MITHRVWLDISNCESQIAAAWSDGTDLG